MQLTLLYVCRMFKGGIFKPNDENVVHFYFEKPGFPSGLFKKVGMSAVIVILLFLGLEKKGRSLSHTHLHGENNSLQSAFYTDWL